jgi:hypothetical protein
LNDVLRPLPIQIARRHKRKNRKSCYSTQAESRKNPLCRPSPIGPSNSFESTSQIPQSTEQQLKITAIRKSDKQEYVFKLTPAALAGTLFANSSFDDV